MGGQRIGLACSGFFVFAAGIVMLVLPGPGVLATAIGLGMLGLEFHGRVMEVSKCG